MCRKISELPETVDQFQQIDLEIEEEMAVPNDDFVILNDQADGFYEPPIGVLRSLGSTLLKALVLIFAIIIGFFPEHTYNMLLIVITVLVIVLRKHIIGFLYALYFLLRYLFRN